MRPLRVAYCLIGFFFVAERFLRQGENSKSLKAGQEDRGSTRAIGASFGLALLTLLFAPFLNRRGIGRLHSERLAWGGIVAMLSGLMLRIWAIRVLGSFFTRTLRTDTEQHLIEEGPYGLVRHPGYLGDLLMWIGAGTATSNWIAATVISLPMLGSYWYRMQAEEAMLTHAFPKEYQIYTAYTWRLIPFVY